MLVNLSNHPSAGWHEGQRDAALRLGGAIRDFVFPEVDPELDLGRVRELAGRITDEVMVWQPMGVMVQGEFTLTYCLVRNFVELSVPCYAACSRRVTQVSVDAGGATLKTSRFEFVRFRRYQE